MKPQTLPKVTLYQMDVLRGLARGKMLVGGGHNWWLQNNDNRGTLSAYVRGKTVDTLEDKSLIEWQPCTNEHDRRFILTPLGLKVLEAEGRS